MSVGPSILARALDPTVLTPDDAMSEKILDAALDLAVTSGLRHLTVDEVAQRAGVGRITIYRRFSDKQGLNDAMMLRETRRSLTALRASINPRLPVDEQIVEGFVTTLRLARTHPLLVRLVRVERETILTLLNTPEVFGLLRGFMAIQIHAVHARTGGRDLAIDTDVLAEVIVRLGMSFLLIPESLVQLDDDEAVRALARHAIVPLLARAQ